MAALEFTDEEWRRPHRLREDTPGFGHREWDAHAMQWEIYGADGVRIGTVCPDHERLTRAETEHYERVLRQILGQNWKAA